MIPNPEMFVLEQMEQRRCRKQVSRIVDYLITVLRIPEGSHLVFIFGSGHERTNRDAMITWVNSIFNEFNADEAEARLEAMVRRTRLKIINGAEPE